MANTYLNHKIKKDTWIFWRWKNREDKAFHKSFVQEVIETSEGQLLQLSDNKFGSSYPTRILLKEIQVL